MQIFRVEASITDHLSGFVPNLEYEYLEYSA